MSLFGIGSQPNAVNTLGMGAQGAATPVLASGGGMIFPGQAAYPGGYMVQQNSGGGIGSIIKKALVGGVAGAGLGAGYGLLAGMVSFLPHITVPMGALIGGVAGAALGLVKGIIDNRNGKLAMQRQVQPGAGVTPIALPNALAGKTFRIGASNATVRTTQRQLKRLGLLQGKVTNRLDRRTADAIRRYEVLKGALPTGDCTPDLRAALSQDVRMLNYA